MLVWAFDVYDTLLTWPFLRPVDAFALVGRALAQGRDLARRTRVAIYL